VKWWKIKSYWRRWRDYAVSHPPSSATPSRAPFAWNHEGRPCQSAIFHVSIKFAVVKQRWVKNPELTNLNCKRKLEIATAIADFDTSRVFASFGDRDASSFGHRFLGVDVNRIHHNPFFDVGQLCSGHALQNRTVYCFCDSQNEKKEEWRIEVLLLRFPNQKKEELKRN